MVLCKISDRNLKVEKAINRAIKFIKNYKPKDTCEKIIKYFLLISLNIEDRNEIQEKDIISNFINENSEGLANYTIVEPGSGLHHFGMFLGSICFLENFWNQIIR